MKTSICFVSSTRADYSLLLPSIKECLSRKSKGVKTSVIVTGSHTIKSQAETILREYNAKVPFVKQLANRAAESADKNGAIWTLKGRKCRFEQWEPSSFGLHKPTNFEDAVNKYGKNNIKRAMTYKALNRLI